MADAPGMGAAGRFGAAESGVAGIRWSISAPRARGIPGAGVTGSVGIIVIGVDAVVAAVGTMPDGATTAGVTGAGEVEADAVGVGDIAAAIRGLPAAGEDAPGSGDVGIATGSVVAVGSAAGWTGFAFTPPGTASAWAVDARVSGADDTPPDGKMGEAVGVTGCAVATGGPPLFPAGSVNGSADAYESVIRTGPASPGPIEVFVESGVAVPAAAAG